MYILQNTVEGAQGTWPSLLR
ncbi:TPA: hypothetical protein ANIA_11638 [Aspergillus nidulans FGSC A4]|uniref:Uncharacterized protein n=1 Tax=Emericella nidulans (strain FGSC A4 / ATCC 38163 / CBS 112.46 / NRRL 194 / M139) TaxID=227321 RepID=C8VL75_EMENI|nr:TPA: hypothetical protein ANIA_11638 [Aspergillus nidulans FGSC A4]